MNVQLFDILDLNMDQQISKILVAIIIRNISLQIRDLIYPMEARTADAPYSLINNQEILRINIVHCINVD